MKISDLIKELLTLLKEEGDLDVYVRYGCCEVVGEPEARVSDRLGYQGVHLN